MTLNVILELSGGAELLFNKVKKHEVKLPDRNETCKKKIPNWIQFSFPPIVNVDDQDVIVIPFDGNMRSLLPWIRDNLLQERPELFMQGETVRPGILVLVNDADWELMGELDYELQDKDRIVFISTLHGG